MDRIREGNVGVGVQGGDRGGGERLELGGGRC